LASKVTLTVPPPTPHSIPMEFETFDNRANPISELERLEKLAERQISILQRRVVDTEAAYIEDSRMRNGGCSVLSGWEGYMDRKAADLLSASNVSKYRGTVEDRIFSRSSALSDPSQNRNLAFAPKISASSSITINNTQSSKAMADSSTPAKTGKTKGKREKSQGKVKGKRKKALQEKNATAVKAESEMDEAIEEQPASGQRSRSRSSSRARRTSEDRIVGSKSRASESTTGNGRARRKRKKSS
jgi:hypothetical protein